MDMRTVIFGNILTDLLCLVVVASLWRQHRRRYAGLGFWLADWALQLAAALLLALRGVVPDRVSMFGSTASVLAGTVLLLVGLERFVEKRGPQAHNLALFGALAAGLAYFTLLRPSLAGRSILVSIGLFVLCAQCVWLLWRRVEGQMRRVTSAAGIVLSLFCAVSLLRVGLFLVLPSPEDFFRSDVYQTLSVLVYQMLFIALTFSLVLMVNRRLVLELDRDIEARQRAEAVVRLRLTLWEYGAAHTLGELMQRALDEICALTASPIGFYHFVEEDQDTLSLQAWSTRTVQEFCTAEGPGLHYPVSKAGVWADAFRTRRAVIHNDYASLPHRKGLPEGHAQVVRELVVPVVRGDRVVSLLGVGNKATPYDEADVGLVSFTADLIWTIVEKKRAEEHIRDLNTRLERLALTDDLTGLSNRRAFFARGAEEVKRARRFGTPLALFMVDLDEFKRVNDTHGHETGDRALQGVAARLRENLREVDLLARLGGEEFGILLPNTGASGALELSERLRRAFETELPGAGVTLTLSIGVAAFGKEAADLDALLRAADNALYRAKNLGRNRVVFAG